MKNTGTTVLIGPLALRLHTVFGQLIELSSTPETSVLAPGAEYRAHFDLNMWPSFVVTPEAEMQVLTGGQRRTGEEIRRPVAASGRLATVLPVAALTWFGVVCVAVPMVWTTLVLLARSRANPSSKEGE